MTLKRYSLWMKTIAIILAGGSGTRFHNSLPKQFHKIGKRALLEICLQRFQGCKGIDAIVLVCPHKNLTRARKIAGAFSKVAKVVPGGRTRQESSAIGVAEAGESGRVLIHDAARALVPQGVIDRVLKGLARHAAVMPVIPAGDTTVRVDERGAVTAVLDRDKLRRVQTPQGLRANVIRRAHAMARSEGFAGAPDDCSLVLRYGLAPVATVEGDQANIKVTVPPDLVMAETILKKRPVPAVKRRVQGKKKLKRVHWAF